MSICQIEERDAGRPYPRTCPTCGLGKGGCVKGLDRQGLHARIAALRPILEEIEDKGRALRQGGPDPMDLTDLSDALQDAVDLAGQALSILDGAALAVTEREAKEGR